MTLPYTRQWVTRLSERGIPYSVWEKCVPPIDQAYLECVVYIYKSEADAKAGEQFGGSGFLVSVPYNENQDRFAIYAVTNNHVINGCRNTAAIRLNTVDGQTDVIKTNPEDWMRHAEAVDIRAIPLQLPHGQYKHGAVPVGTFLSREIARILCVGPGDDAFMVGRFVNHEGKQRNTPSVRFGNISMMPHEPIRDRYGIDQESFLVECRSIPGYSGSPVFLSMTPAVKIRGRVDLENFWKLSPHHPASGPWLLGVDWCHLSNDEPIFDVHGDEKTRHEGMVARSNTSMAGVIPAWLLMELLNEEDLVRQREEEDKAISKQRNKSHVVEDSADKSDSEDSRFTQHDFEAALRKVSRKISPPKG
jgi:hypothetical protein